MKIDRSYGTIQTKIGSLESSSSEVDSVAVLEPDFSAPTRADHLRPKPEHPLGGLVSSHFVRATAQVSNISKVREILLLEQRAYLFVEREERRVVWSNIGVIRQSGIDVADADELKLGMRW